MGCGASTGTSVQLAGEPDRGNGGKSNGNAPVVGGSSLPPNYSFNPNTSSPVAGFTTVSAFESTPSPTTLEKPKIVDLISNTGNGKTSNNNFVDKQQLVVGGVINNSNGSNVAASSSSSGGGGLIFGTGSGGMGYGQIPSSSPPMMSDEEDEEEDEIERYSKKWHFRSLGTSAVIEASSITHIGATSPLSGQPIKTENQDVVTCHTCFDNSKEYSLLAVFDGHGTDGLGVASLCEQLMVRKLRLAKMEGTYPPTALTQAFLSIQREVGMAQLDSKFSGATASVAIVAGRTLFFAHAGDSRGILVSRNAFGRGVSVRELGFDHRPEQREERERIEMAGGRVVVKTDDRGNPIGPARVYHIVDPFPGLMLSRSLGDSYAHAIGVSHVPEISIVEVDSSASALVIASDGVWDVLSSQEVGDFVGESSSAEMAGGMILQAALQRWEARGSADNIGIVVAFFAQ